MRKSLCLALLLLLAGCDREERPPAPTAEESARLDDAEAMLNQFNEEGPAPDGAGPSDNNS